MCILYNAHVYTCTFYAIISLLIEAPHKELPTQIYRGKLEMCNG